MTDSTPDYKLSGKGPRVVVTVVLPRKQLELLEEISEAAIKSRSQVIRDAIAKYLHGYPGTE